MDQRLIEEIMARVAAKLADAEGKAECTCQPECEAKPGLLVLSEQTDETCRALLNSAKLKEQFRVDCTSLQSNPADPEKYDVIILAQLSNELLGKLALGICDTPESKLVSQAILMGKHVFVPTEQVELYRYATTAPAPYYSMMKERLDLLLHSGVTICAQGNLECAVLNGTEPAATTAESCPCAAEPVAVSGPQASKELCLSKRVLTEQDVRNAAAEKVTCIRIPAKCILTALAKDCAKDHGICLVQD